ncbi:hypothetical protein [Methanoculleus sp.]|uniref:LolA family protein n=1 Tax=Methanoculleus sp. TaxID=90427 RepID=UPI001BD54BC0|nr:hypothetical protein [Methanoculleus sp.]
MKYDSLLLFSVTLLFILLVSIMASAGCTGTPNTVAEIVEEYRAQTDSIDDYSMSVVQTLPGGLHHIEIIYKRPYQYLLRHRYDPDDRTWSQSVHNLTFTEYHPESQTADILAIQDPETCFPLIADPNRLASPVLFSGDFDLSYQGTGTVNGREAYIIKATNTGHIDYFGEGRDGNVRIWIDREAWIVTRIQAFDAAGNMKTSFEVKNFTINSGISDNEFIISLPEGVKIRHPNPFC